jgi:hypothetical protein
MPSGTSIVRLTAGVTSSRLSVMSTTKAFLKQLAPSYGSLLLSAGSWQEFVDPVDRAAADTRDYVGDQASGSTRFRRWVSASE